MHTVLVKRIILAIILICLIIAGGLAVQYYQWIFGPQVPEDLTNTTLYILEDQTVSEIAEKLTDQGMIKNPRAFLWVADKMHYDDAQVKPGHYTLEQGMHTRDLVSKLRAGDQTPVNVTLRNATTWEDLAGQIDRQLALDSATFVEFVRNNYLNETDFSLENILTLYLPNTYEVYWTITEKQFQKRMEQEHARFWNPSRKAQADAIGLSPEEVYILASIIDRETRNTTEMPRIAGVYLNRLKRGMLLQADPTVIYAIGDFSIRRVLKKHLEIASPYNTYLFTGLPPGPICMPSIRSIEAVLNAENHNYLFFCAKPGYEGSHLFAENLSGHLRNARKYQRWLNQEGIR